MRSGKKITQETGYKSFIPKSLPPNPPVQVENEIQHLLTDANIAIGKMDTMGYLAPNLDHIILERATCSVLLGCPIDSFQTLDLRELIAAKKKSRASL